MFCFVGPFPTVSLILVRRNENTTHYYYYHYNLFNFSSNFQYLFICFFICSFISVFLFYLKRFASASLDRLIARSFAPRPSLAPKFKIRERTKIIKKKKLVHSKREIISRYIKPDKIPFILLSSSLAFNFLLFLVIIISYFLFLSIYSIPNYQH